MTSSPTLGVIAASALLLVACGGGGGSSATPTAGAASSANAAASTASSPSGSASATSTGASAPGSSASAAAAGAAGAAGLWTGSTSDGRTYAQMVLGSGAYYMFYSPVGDTSHLGGVMVGTGTASGQTYAAPDGRVFDIQTSGVQSTALTGAFVAGSSFSGSYTVNANGSTTLVNFNGNYDPTSTATPALADLAGTYAGSNGTNAGVQTGATLTVGLDGAVIVNATNCSASGKATPRSDGNAFDLALKFSPTCVLAGQSVTGAVYNNLAAHRIYTLTPTADRNDFFLFVGDKQ